MPTPNQRLDSWKEIATFFGCDESTVRRWEKERGLPVHRLPGIGRGKVFAYSDELSGWLKGPRSSEPISESTAGPGVRLGTRKLWLLALPLLALTVGALLLLPGKRVAPGAGVGHASDAPRSPANAEAQDLYLKGRFYWSKRTAQSLNQAVDYFTQSIVHDPNYAPAYVGLADCYNLLREYAAMPNQEAYPRALAAARKAVELDDTLAEAHASLAFGSFYWDWDATTAEREFKRAIELDPNNATIHHWYANVLATLGRPQEARAEIERARELDPSSRSILADQGYVMFLAGQQRQAIELLQQMEASDPEFISPHKYLSWMYFSSKDYANSLAESKKTAALLHDADSLSGAETEEKSFASGGEPALLQTMLQIEKKRFQENRGSAYAVASACATLGRKQEALQYLQMAYDRHDNSIVFLKLDPTFRSLRDETAYRDLLARVGLLRS